MRYTLLLVVTFFYAAWLVQPDPGQVPLPVDHDIIEIGHATVCYDRRTRCPRWVFEHLTQARLTGEAIRSNKFYSPATPPEFVVELADYLRSGYDRGHAAPAADFASDQLSMDQSFNLANVYPQSPTLNRGLWARLEHRCRSLTDNGDVYVVTCPIWTKGNTGEVVYRLLGDNEVAVPTHIGKAILYKLAGEWTAEAYVIPNMVPKSRSLEDYRVTTDQFEHLAGVDVWSHLTEQQALVIESR